MEAPSTKLKAPGKLQAPMSCQHETFESSVAVGRLTKGEGGPVREFMAEIKIRCGQCGAQFRFVGLSCGISYEAPLVSLDGSELRAPIVEGLTINTGTL